jgi:signal transduction histidine kinase
VANNGSVVGALAIGRALPELYSEDLNRLTGFDVVLSLGGQDVGRSSAAPQAAAGSDGRSPYAAIPLRQVAPLRVGGEDVLAYRLEDPASGLSVTFVGSAARAISPIMANVRRLLLGLAAVGFLLAMVTVWTFGSRRVGGPVQRLARHAERIATGDLDFVIEEPGVPDELGILATTLERMRADLARSRSEVESAHRAQLGAERLAAIGQMATGIIHDFKNPMAVVRGTADLIHARDPGNEKLARQCSVIHRQIDRMLGLTRDLLEYARGRTEL